MQNPKPLAKPQSSDKCTGDARLQPTAQASVRTCQIRVIRGLLFFAILHRPRMTRIRRICTDATPHWLNLWEGTVPTRQCGCKRRDGAG
jgi:hypothetical protein